MRDHSGIRRVLADENAGSKDPRTRVGDTESDAFEAEFKSVSRTARGLFKLVLGVLLIGCLGLGALWLQSPGDATIDTAAPDPAGPGRGSGSSPGGSKGKDKTPTTDVDDRAKEPRGLAKGKNKRLLTVTSTTDGSTDDDSKDDQDDSDTTTSASTSSQSTSTTDGPVETTTRSGSSTSRQGSTTSSSDRGTTTHHPTTRVTSTSDTKSRKRSKRQNTTSTTGRTATTEKTTTTNRPTTTNKTATTKRTTTTYRATTERQTTRPPVTTARTTTTTRPTTTSRPPTTAQPTTQPPTTSGSNSGALLFQENFDSLNTSRWKVEHSAYGGINGEVQCYQPNNVWVSGGKLVLRAKKESYDCPRAGRKSYTSGMVRLQDVEFKPGQAVEFRVKLNPGNRDTQAGLFPAVWSSSWSSGGWPKGGEVDYLEVMTVEDPKRAMFSMHYQGKGGGHELKNKGAYLGEYFSDSWHTIRFEYGYNGRLRWLMDGKETFVVDHAATSQGYPAPFDQTIREIKINLALGGHPGPLNDAALGSSGATFEVDYLRIYKL